MYSKTLGLYILVFTSFDEIQNIFLKPGVGNLSRQRGKCRKIESFFAQKFIQTSAKLLNFYTGTKTDFVCSTTKQTN